MWRMLPCARHAKVVGGVSLEKRVAVTVRIVTQDIKLRQTVPVQMIDSARSALPELMKLAKTRLLVLHVAAVQPGAQKVLLSAQLVWYVNQATTRMYLVLLLWQVSVQSVLQELTLPAQLKLPIVIVKLALAHPGASKVQSHAQVVKLALLGHIIALNVQLLQRVGARTVLLVLTPRPLTRAHVPSVLRECTLLKVPHLAKLVRRVRLGTTSRKTAPMAQTHSAQSVAQAFIQVVRMNRIVPSALNQLTGVVRGRRNVMTALFVNQGTTNPEIVLQ